MLRGFTAFDIFLEQHPEFRERVTFIAHLQPSRQDVPEYVEYLEKIEALVAVINHRHGTTDWMPIDLRLRDDFEEAVALYKHYDLLLVNAMWDGMNLVAKEGPLVNTRDGMIVLSENTGAHEELGECALSVNPFDVQEQADAMHHALTASAGRAPAADGGAAADHHLPHAGRLDRPATRRHRGEARGDRRLTGAANRLRAPNSPTGGGPRQAGVAYAAAAGTLRGAADGRPRAREDVAVAAPAPRTAPRPASRELRCCRALQRRGRDAPAVGAAAGRAGAAPIREARASGAAWRPPPTAGRPSDQHGRDRDDERQTRDVGPPDALQQSVGDPARLSGKPVHT